MCTGLFTRSIMVGLAMGFVTSTSSAGAESGENVRPASHAGSWYPGDPAALGKTIDELLAAAPEPRGAGRPIAIISPHAGYRYSAPVAAAGYRHLQGHVYKRVIVLAFSHRNAGRVRGVDVPAELSAYQTPLGNVAIDRKACDRLLAHPLFASHADMDKGEHSLELQLPFLQRLLPGFSLVPLMVGRMSTEDYAEAAKAVLPLLDDDTLLVVSSDFTHFGPRFGYEPFRKDVPTKLRELADRAAAPLLHCDYDGFVEHLADTKDTICGRGPITLALRILSMRGSADGVRAATDTSGHITGDWSNSVTYLSVVFLPRKGTLTRDQQDRLLDIARRTVTAHLRGEPIPTVDEDTLAEPLRTKGGCFVTLKNHERLRGCIGNLIAQDALYKSVIQNAVSACKDYRFVNNPVTTEELDRIDIEISYLTPMIRVEDVRDIIIGRHGLLISARGRRGVLLPQVAYERGWTREEFLAQTCRKAGLPPDTWKKPNAELYSFRAEVFGEAQRE